MNSSTKHIAYAVMVNGNSLKKWQFDCLDKLNENGCSCVLIVSNSGSGSSRIGFFRKIFKRDFLYKFLLKRLFKVDAEIDVALPDSVPVLSIEAMAGKFSHRFSNKDISQIVSFQPQFILRFGYNILRGDILNCCPWGIWSFHHADERKYRGGPFGFWEIVRRDRSSGVILQRLTEKLDAGHVLLRREYNTVFHSWKEMRQRLLIENTDMPLLAAKIFLFANEALPAPTETQAPIYRNPGFFRMCCFVVQLWLSRFVFHFNRLFIYESWHVESGSTAGSPFELLAPDVKWLPKNRSEFIADPFVAVLNSKFKLFAEHFNYNTGKGVIAELSDNGQKSIFLERRNHLAYPFVFKHNEHRWIIPENADSTSCIAYRLNNDGAIVSETVLLNLPVVDPSVVFFENRFYLFCGLKNNYPNEKLNIFWADDFEGPWQPHGLNPVKVTPSGSRSGGSFVKWNENWFRPAQVSLKYYGQNIQIFKILQLSPDEFVEVLESEILPSTFCKNAAGLHTFSLSENRYAVDIKMHRFGLAAFRFRLKL